jgi:hypothetical protein
VDLVQPGEAQSRPAVLLGHADDTEDGRTWTGGTFKSEQQ